MARYELSDLNGILFNQSCNEGILGHKYLLLSYIWVHIYNKLFLLRLFLRYARIICSII